MTELKPCPFCGGDAVAEEYICEAAVRCPTCKATLVHESYPVDLSKAITLWDTRPTEQALQEENTVQRDLLWETYAEFSQSEIKGHPQLDKIHTALKGASK